MKLTKIESTCLTKKKHYRDTLTYGYGSIYQTRNHVNIMYLTSKKKYKL